jgi:ureidoacrylate peracid hydrolase
MVCRSHNRCEAAAGSACCAASEVEEDPLMNANHTIHVEARPAAVDLDPARTAVIVVDMQNHFASPGGTFANGGIDTQPILDVIAPTARVLDAARDAGVAVIYLRVNAPSEPVPGGAPALRNSAGGELRWRRYMELVATREPSNGALPPDASPTWNADIVDGLEPRPGELVVTKPRFSGFHGTDLHDQLQARGISDLVFTGCTTSICVESTLRDAYHRGYGCVLLEDCVAEPIGHGANHDATVLATELLLGYVTGADAVCVALSRVSTAANA